MRHISSVAFLEEIKRTKKPNEYYCMEMFDDDGNRYYQTREKTHDGWYKITTRYSDKHIEVEYERDGKKEKENGKRKDYELE